MRARLITSALAALVSALSAHACFQDIAATDVGIMFAGLAGVFTGFTFITWQDAIIHGKD